MTKATKTSGLAAFNTKAAAANVQPQNETRIRRGKGDTVALTVRLPKPEWMKLRQFAMSEGETIQTLAISGFNLLLAAKGQRLLDA